MSKEQDYLKFQIRRKVTNLFKNIFFLIEDLKRENPSISNEKYDHVRKRVLDYSNDTIRDLQNDIDQFDINV